MKSGFLITLSLLSVLMIGMIINKSITLKQNCTGYLKRAADANTVETARDQLQKATTYLEENGLTSGYRSVMWQTPDEDISFWYNNLKSSEKELSKVDSTTSALEKTNLLMKLRETLLDGGKEGDSITVPTGISRYPNNGFWGITLLLSILVILLSGTVFAATHIE